ncbi:hypothetical protein JCM8547_001600, partial [Rhodosporidiobolus lusitaniae]
VWVIYGSLGWGVLLAPGYLQRPDAVARNLTTLPSPSTFRLSTDSSSTLSLGENRDSVRLSSVSTVGPGSLVLASFGHVPTGCGSWPAFWLYGDPWPTQGEIDVAEYVNERAYNSMSLHTIPGCSRNRTSSQTGTWAYTGSIDRCDTSSGSACTVQDPSPLSAGAGWNAAGGGVFAVQIAEDGISIWRWQKSDVPLDVQEGNPRPQTWGVPVARWDGETCDTRTYLGEMWITLNITICGRMAGKTSTWRSPSLSGPSCYARYPTCAHAAADPEAFRESYFDVEYVKVYSV